MRPPTPQRRLASTKPIESPVASSRRASIARHPRTGRAGTAPRRVGSPGRRLPVSHLDVAEHVVAALRRRTPNGRRTSAVARPTATTMPCSRVLPCYANRSLARGRTLRLLGDGEVCSEHLGLLGASPDSADVAAKRWPTPSWSPTRLGSRRLCRRRRGRLTHRTAARRAWQSPLPTSPVIPGNRTWAIDLPGDWEEFLALQSKSHRKQLRQLERRVARRRPRPMAARRRRRRL